MITFLASPKPFQGIAKEHQYRAIRSWQAAGEGAEVLLYGDSDGIEEAGSDLGAQVVKQIGCAPSGIPYFGAIADHAAQHGRHDLQVYLNCDILLSGLLLTLQAIPFPRFLLIGERIDLAEGVVLDVPQPGWQDRLKELVQVRQATLHGPTGIDYFAFRRGLWAGMPPVVIGRGGYDNALLAHCFRKNIPIIDATERVLALHQYHDYGHVEGGESAVFQGEEAKENARTAGGRRSATLVSDATHMLRLGGLIHQPCRGDRLRSLELQLRYQRRKPGLALAIRVLWRALAASGLRRSHGYDLAGLVASNV